MKKIQFLVLAFIVTLLQACSEYCATYGYFELQSSDAKTTVVEHTGPSGVAGLSDAVKFPSGYRVDKGNYQLFIEQLVDRGYPTALIRVKSKAGKVMNLKVHNDDECFYSTGAPSGTESEILWRSDMSCNSNYPLVVDVSDDIGGQVEVFSMKVFLQKNGQKCELDGL